MFLILLAAIAFQDVARPASPDDVRDSPTIFVPVPIIRVNGLLPAPGMFWIEVPNPHYHSPGENAA